MIAIEKKQKARNVAWYFNSQHLFDVAKYCSMNDRDDRPTNPTFALECKSNPGVIKIL